jgi:putative aminopeptidase FrvX
MSNLGRIALLLLATWLLAPAAPVFPQGDEGKEFMEIFRQLIDVPGVSFHEEKVLQKIKELLPGNLEATVDEMNNLLVILGTGKPEIMFVTHMDEIGLEVTEIQDDGSLKTRARGGSFSSIWESKTVRIHTKTGMVEGIVEPRKSYREPDPKPHSADDLVVYVGTDAKAATAALGIAPGDFIVQPKRVTPLGNYKTAAGSTDDRAGCAAQILALRRLAGRKLPRTVAFAWVVQEETGLSGSRFLSRSYAPEYVFAVDTFVSSDTPLDPKNIGFNPQGKGAVLRVIDSSNITPEETFRKVRRLAESRNIPVQWGITSGGNDGSVFLREGSVDIPLSWPGIYSHSYVSVMDIRDVMALTHLIAAIAESF